MAAEINRGSQNLVVTNVEKPHIYRGGGKKIFVNAIAPHFTSSQWRRKTSLILNEINKKQNNCLMALAMLGAHCER